MMATRGKILGLALLASLPVFVVGGAWVFLEGLKNGQKSQAIMGFICLFFFGVGSVLFAPSRKYIPGKTFQGYRNKKLNTRTAVYYGYAIIIFICSVFAVLVPKDMLKALGYGVVGIVGIYYYSKSLKFHADIDFSTNEYLATALGFPAGEKILLSYQNFDAGEVEAGCNAFAATATKLIVASFDGNVWEKLSRDLNQISRIGIIGDESQNYYVKLQFNDGADALLRIGLYEKLTSNPVLVVRRLLETIDASLLSDNGTLKTAPRRRVVVSSAAPISISEDVAPESTRAAMVPVRKIEVAPDVLNAIRSAEEVAPGRRLEL